LAESGYVNFPSLAQRTNLAAIGLALVAAGVNSLGGQERYRPSPTTTAALTQGQEATLFVTTPTAEQLPGATAGDVVSQEGVFAPFPGKSPCGEFDSPYNNYFGDTRINRSFFLGRLWMEAEYLAWASKGTHLPPLVTTSPAGTAEADAGVLGLPGTTILFGNTTVHDTLRSGARLNFGYWFTPEHIQGLEAHFLWLDGRNIDFNASSDEQPILAHPIIDTVTGADRILVAFPGVQEGSTRVRSDMGLFGLELLGRHMMAAECNSRLDFVAGYRYARLFDGLRIRDEIFVPDSIDPDTILIRTDAFVSKNDFHGGELGLVYRWWNCCWAAQLVGKAALGGTRTMTTIDGQTVEITATPPATTTVGGVFAQPSNVGQYAQSQFAAVLEFGGRVEYAFTPQLRFTLGYNYLWWSRVARVPDSLDVTIDTAQLPGAARPGFTFNSKEFWSHGLTLGGYYDF
jgi:putative beta barrel porin BBP7